jgi:signal peptidase I
VIDERDQARASSELPQPVNEAAATAVAPVDDAVAPVVPQAAESVPMVEAARPPEAVEIEPSEPQWPTPRPPSPPASDALGLPTPTEAPRLAAAPADPARPFQEAIVQPDVRPTSPGVRLAQVKEELVAWVKTLVSAAVYAVLIVTFGFQVARVEGQSMAPTLEDQDRLIVNKLVYRIGEPRRGDIVMLYYPLNPDKSFVKRVIAEEGDTVRIVDGRVYVNDIPLKDDYVPSEFRSHDDWGPQVIPEGYYFVMGDHRNNSSDSRHWGMVPKKYIIGKVQLRWWPVPTARMF